MTQFTSMTGPAFRRTLVADLSPVADEIRDLATEFGLRPYVVRIIRAKSSGNARGGGAAWVDGEPTVLLPTPRVLNFGGLDEMLTPAGIDEFGAITLDGISATRYTEDVLMGRGAGGAEPDRTTQVFYEVEWFNPDGSTRDKRRFTLDKAPEFRAGRLDWTITLQRSRADRSRDGGVR